MGFVVVRLTVSSRCQSKSVTGGRTRFDAPCRAMDASIWAVTNTVNVTHLRVGTHECNMSH